MAICLRRLFLAVYYSCSCFQAFFFSELVSPTMAETHKIGIRRSCVWSLYAAWVLLLQLLSLVFQEEVKRSDAVAAKNKLTILSQGYDSTTFFACAH